MESGVLVSATDDTPSHCRVRGTIDGTIRFEIRMPAEGWTGRFMFHAPGGLAGVIGDTSSLLDDGFAMATTDTGHEAENDPSFYRDDHAKLNFAFRANHLTTVLSQAHHPGVLRPAGAARVPVGLLQRRACGAGGGVALSGRLRRHHRRGSGNRLRAWPAGMGAGSDPAPGPQPPLPRSPWCCWRPTRGEPATCSTALPTVWSEIPAKCTVELLELDALECRDGPAADCLTAGQIETARYVYTGITDESGAVVVPGVYPGGELGGDFELWVTGPVPFLEGTASDTTVEVLKAVMHRKPGFSIETFDPVRDLDELKDTMVSVDIPAPDFSRFQESGGKLIIYNGWHDQPWPRQGRSRASWRRPRN